jgi:nucleoside-diphosphate-sugar epimerase
MRVAITGASGFIGRVLVRSALADECEVLALSRCSLNLENAASAISPELSSESDWRPVLEGSDVVIHLAGLSHADSGEPRSDMDKAYLRVNAEGTRTLAEQATAVGVRHFIFMSSCHAVSAQSESRLTSESPPQPSSIYGRSKLAGENAIRDALANTACHWTILRPPLVYGSGNEGNFGLLLKIVRTGLPMPLASVSNKRSFLFVENLADAVNACIANRIAFGKVFYPSDGRDISTPELIRMISSAAGVQARLFPFPESLLKAASRLAGLGVVGKLTASLCVDSLPMTTDLGWSPRIETSEGLRLSLQP